MSVAERKKQVVALTPQEVAELSTYIAKPDAAAWDAELDRDFSEGGRLRAVLARRQEYRRSLAGCRDASELCDRE